MTSPMTRGLDEGGPSATRTTLTSPPFAHNPSDKAALNVASPHGVGGYVLRMPKLGEREKRCGTIVATDDRMVGGAIKVIPTGSCYRRVRRERLLGEVSGVPMDQSRTGWVPNIVHATPRRSVGC